MSTDTPDKSYRRAFAIGFIWWIALSALFSTMYGHVSALAVGRFLGMTMITSAMAGFVAARAAKPWSTRKFWAMYFLMALVVWVISSRGLMQMITA